MTPEAIPVALFAFLAVGAVALSPIFRAIARRMERSSLPPDAGSAELRERMERMEQALDAIAVQVERIAEGQRFTTKLLSDRTDEANQLMSSERRGNEV
jgi:hypothetical protein